MTMGYHPCFPNTRRRRRLRCSSRNMQSSEEPGRTQAKTVQPDSSVGAPAQTKRRSRRSAFKKAAERCKASRLASREQRRRRRAAKADNENAGAMELQGSRHITDDNSSTPSPTKAQTIVAASPSQERPSQRKRSGPGVSICTLSSNEEPRAKSSVSHEHKPQAPELGLPRDTTKSGHIISSDTESAETLHCAPPLANARREVPASETRSLFEEKQDPNLKGDHQTAGPSNAPYADERHAPDSTPPNVTFDCDCDLQNAEKETSLTELSKVNPPAGRRHSRETPCVHSRRSLIMEVGSHEGTVLSRSKSILFFWRLASSECCSADSSRCEKSKRQPPSTSPVASTDESRLSKASRTTLFVALLIPCAVVGLIALVLIRAHPKSRQAKHALWIEELVSACVTVDCHSAVWELTSSIDVSVDPCKDFYRFTCGRWGNASSAARNDGKPPSSYMGSQRHAYVGAVNATLLKARRRVSSMMPCSTTQRIADVYRSCLNFFDEQPVNVRETMRASGIQLSAWMAATTFEELFALAVAHTLFYNATSAINVRWINTASNSTSPGMVEISPGMSLMQRMGSSSRRSLLSRALPIVENYTTTERIRAIERIDDSLAASNSTTCSNSEVTEMSLMELDTQRVNWSHIVGEYAKVTGNEPPPSMVRVFRMTGVRAIMNLLENSSLSDLKIYLMLVPLSEFFALEDIVQRQEPTSVGDDDDVSAVACVRALELLFGDHYCSWVRAHVYKPGTSIEVARIWQQVREATHKFLMARREIPAEHTSELHIGNEASQPCFASTASLQPRDPAVLPSQYSEDFVSNVIFFSQKSSLKRNGCEPFLSRDSLTMKWTDRENFFRLLVPDFYHSEATEVAVNYATLGYLLSEFAITLELPTNGTSSEYGSCLARYAGTSLRLKPPPDERWRQLTERGLAAQVALRAAAMRDARIYAGGVLTRLFFLRLEHTCCALTDDVSDRGVLQTMCNLVAMTVPQFADAFGCHNLQRMNC